MTYENCFIAVEPLPEESERIKIADNAYNRLGHHTTLAFLGKAADVPLTAVQTVLENIRWESVTGTIESLAWFGRDSDSLVATVDAPNLFFLRHAIIGNLNVLGIEFSKEFPFYPHITLAYRFPKELEVEAMYVIGERVTYNGLVLVYGDEKFHYPFGLLRH